MTDLEKAAVFLEIIDLTDRCMLRPDDSNMVYARASLRLVNEYMDLDDKFMVDSYLLQARRYVKDGESVD
jgi:hypothetical protein